MTKSDTNTKELRQKAEEQLKKRNIKEVESYSDADLNRLIHELQVQKIELEMQNEELQAAKTTATETAEKYSKLYDFAPAGYCTISKDGEIVELNLRAAEMLGKEKTQLIKRQFGLFVSLQTRPVYNQFLDQVFKSNGKETCELMLSGNRVEPVYVLITGNVVQKEGDCFLTMVDVTERKHAEKELKDAYFQLEKLFQYQDEIKENERKAISRIIHDELGQSLTALKIDLSWIKDNTGDSAGVKKKVKGMNEIVDNSIKTVQQISSDLRPGLLDDLGLVPAIEWYCQEFEKRTGIKCHLNLEEIEFANESKSLAIYRILQEVMTNVKRHAMAKNTDIKFYQKEDSVLLAISDDGKGIKKEKTESYQSLGIVGIKERVKQFNGTLNITSEPNKGTTITVLFPMP